MTVALPLGQAHFSIQTFKMKIIFIYNCLIRIYKIYEHKDIQI